MNSTKVTVYNLQSLEVMKEFEGTTLIDYAPGDVTKYFS